jgi:hypothetical protein
LNDTVAIADLVRITVKQRTKKARATKLNEIIG